MGQVALENLVCAQPGEPEGIQVSKAKLDLAVRILMGRAEPANEEGIRALRYIIAEAQALLKMAEQEWFASLPRGKGSGGGTKQASPVATVALREKAAKAALSLFESVLIQGRAIGSIWYHELEAFETESLFAASLAKQLREYGIPNQPVRVKDWVSQKTLSEMVKKAKRAELVS
jgi:hypothetical protein